MKKPKIIMNNKENANQEWVDELVRLKKEGKLHEYGEQVSFEKGFKSLNAGDIILYKYPNGSICCEARMVARMSSGKQVVNWKFQDVVTKG